jgi:hypothetical protein
VEELAIEGKELVARGKIKWSGMRESNPRLDLGKVAYYHYTNPAEHSIHNVLNL